MNPDAIPQELRARDQWVLWRLERRNGKLTKVPYNARTGKKAKSNDPTTWSSFAAAVEGLATFSECNGIGYIFSGEDPFVGVDLDHCFGPEGNLSEQARLVVDSIPTYWEKSQSGTGAHGIAIAKLPPRPARRVSRALGIELYDDVRLFATTGERVDGALPAIADCSVEILRLHARVFPLKEKPVPTNGYRPVAVPDMDDRELLDRLFHQKEGGKWERLYRGAWTGEYPSQSEAEQALGNKLAFYAGPDAARIEVLLRQSGLAREKWDTHRTYLSGTIAKAIDSCAGAFYEARPARTVASNGTAPARECGPEAGPKIDREDATAHLPPLETNLRRLREKTAHALKVLLARNSPPVVFIRGGRLVRVDVDEEGRPAIQTMTPAMVRNRLERCANWISTSTKKGVTCTVPVAPPKDVVDDLLALPDWPDVPALTGIVTAPVVSKDGVLLTDPGYHPSSRLYYHPGDLGQLPDSTPTAARVKAAKELLLNGLLGEFPFADAASRAHALALLLEPFLRPLIGSSTPLFAIDAPCPGTGKSLLAQLTSGVFVPNGARVMVEGRNEDEWRKRITSSLMGGPTHILIDNLKQPLNSGVLSGALTAKVWEDRILGFSENAALPIRCTWLCTGNNLVLSDEIVRRSVWIRLNAETEQPWLRTGFKIEDIGLWAIEHRRKLVGATLTLIRAWLEAKRPLLKGQVPGSIDHWARVLGGVLETVGVPDFLGNAAQLYEQVDPGREMWSEFLTACAAEHGDRPFAVSDVFSLAQQMAIGELLGDGTDKSQKTKLGIQLRSACDRVFGGYQLKRAAAAAWAAHYKVVRHGKEG